MSVITSHELYSKGIEKKLRDAGMVGPAVLHGRNGAERHLETVLDMEKCNSVFAAQLKKEYREKGYLKYDDVTHDYVHTEYTENQLDELMKYPVTFGKDGNSVCYMQNYGTTDKPAMAIGKAFPDEIMKYRRSTEGHHDESVYFKNGECCNEKGEPMAGIIQGVYPQSKLNKYGQVRVSVPVDVTDRRFAFLYANPADIMDLDFDNPDRGKSLCFSDWKKELTLYRQKENGDKVKQTMSVETLVTLMTSAKDEYIAKRSKRPLPEVRETTMDEPSVDLGK